MLNILRFHLLVLALVCGLPACDNKDVREVPSNASRGLTPAKIEPRSPEVSEPDPTVIAWVNDDPILQSLVDRVMARKRGSAAVAGARREHVLQAVIDDRLVDQWVAEQGLEISDQEIDEEVEKSVRIVFGSQEALQSHLDGRQMTSVEYRAATGRGLAERRLLARLAKTRDTGPELEALYKDVANRPSETTRFRVSSLLFAASLDAPAVSALVAGARNEAGFRALEGRHSRLGWVEQADLSAPLGKALLRMDPPGATPPIASPSGLEVYWVHERERRPTPHFTEIEPILRRRLEAIALSEARTDLLRTLRDEAEIRLADPTN